MRNKNINYKTEVFTNGNALSYYLLGAFCTDGNVHERYPNRWTANLTSADKQWIIQIKNHISKDLTIHKHKNNKAFSIYINNNRICKWLMKNGCMPRKSLTLQLPKIPKKYQPDFIRGVIDGDGSIGLYETNKNTKRMSAIITITTGSQKFAFSVVKLLDRFKIKSFIIKKTPKQMKGSYIENRKISPKHNIYCVRIINYNAVSLINLIYYNKNILCLERKQNKADTIIKYYSIHIPRRLLPVPNKQNLITILNNTPIKQIAKELKITTKVIYRWMKIYNIPKKGFKLRSKLFNGSNNMASKLTEDDVKHIKQQLKINWHRGILTELANKFNVSRSTISSIKYGKTWQDVK